MAPSDGIEPPLFASKATLLPLQQEGIKVTNDVIFEVEVYEDS